MIAYEMAQQLASAGEAPAALILFDTFAPGGRTKPPLPRRLFLIARKLWQMEPKEKAAYLGKAVSAINGRLRDQIDGLHGSAGSTLVATQKRVQYALRQRALRDYRPVPYPGAMTVIRALNREEGIDIWNPHSSHLGWERFARGGVEVRDVPGSHLGIFDEANVPVLGREVRDCLDGAES